MPTTGFLATRADAFVDAAIVFFVVAPFLMAYALRLAARRCRVHRDVRTVVHLAVAIPTFVIWCSLAVLSWRRFSRTLPGPFGRTHRRWGKLAFVGLCLSSATGTGLYVMGFAF